MPRSAGAMTRMRRKKREEREMQRAIESSENFPDSDNLVELASVGSIESDKSWGNSDGTTGEVGEKDEKEKKKGCDWVSWGKLCSPFHENSPLQETKLYFAFLIIFMSVVFIRKQPVSYEYYQVQLSEWSKDDPSNGISSFLDIESEADFWDYLGGPFIDGLVYDEGYPNQPPYHGSYMIGNVMIRQKRVKSKECEDHTILANVTKRCHPEFSEDDESKETFGNGLYQWRSDPQEDINENLFNPQRSFGLGGFMIEFALPVNVSHSKALVEEMRVNEFIDLQTRLITIERSLYEPNSQLILAIQQELQFNFLGGVVPKENYRVARILQYEYNYELFCFGLECLGMYMILYYILQECGEMYQSGWDYLKDGWNTIDVTNLVLFVCVIYIRIVADVAAYQLRDTIEKDSYVSMQCLLYTFNILNYFNAFNAVLCFLKVFKYLAVSPTLGMLNKVIAVAAPDLFGFLFMFIVIMFGFTIAFYMAFGNNIESFATVSDSAIALFAWSLGGFDYESLTEQNYLLGALLFISYMVLMMLMLLNFAIAIVSNAFDQVNEDIKSAGSENPFVEEIQVAYKSFKKWICRCIPEKTREDLKRMNSKLKNQFVRTSSKEKREGQSHVTVESMKNTLRDDFSHKRDSSIVKLFDVNSDGILDGVEQKELQLHMVMDRKLKALNSGIHENRKLLLELLRKQDLN